MENQYIVKWGSLSYREGEFQEIGGDDNLELWMNDGSLCKGDVIYKLELVGKIIEKKTLELEK